MSERKRWASEELRAVLGEGGPPYDAAKVMAWFNDVGPALLIDLEVLEEDFRLHNADALDVDLTEGNTHAEKVGPLRSL